MEKQNPSQPDQSPQEVPGGNHPNPDQEQPHD